MGRNDTCPLSAGRFPLISRGEPPVEGCRDPPWRGDQAPMNPCREHLENLALFAGGDLPDTPAHALTRHVRDCAGCAATLEGLEADQAALASGASAMVPVDVAPIVSSVMARLASEAC